MAQVTRRLGQFASELQFEALPPAVVHEVKRALLDCIGVGLLGANHKIVAVLLRYLKETRGSEALSASRGATLIGRPETLDPVSAAWVNGTMAHVYDFDDVHSAAGIHPGIVIVPPVLAAAEWAAVSGARAITAMAAGYEVAGRIGEATQLAHYEPGWHSTGTVGTIGAAAATSSVLGLNAAQAAGALGSSSSEAAGLRVSFGSMMKSLHAGNASANGLRAALLVSMGFVGPENAIEGARGFLEVTCNAPIEQEPILDALGEKYCFIKKGYKLYSCGGVVHPALDAALQLRERMGDKAGRVSRIHASVHPQVLEQMRVKEPETGMQSKFSPYHAIAVTLLDGQALPDQFTDARAISAEVRDLRQRIDVESSSSVRKDEARLTATLESGERLEIHVPHALGYSPENPPSDAQLEEKFMALAIPLLGERRSRDLCNVIWTLEAEPDLKKLMRLTRPA